MEARTRGDLPPDVRARIKSAQDTTMSYFAERLLQMVADRDNPDTPKPAEYAEGIIHATNTAILAALKSGGYTNDQIQKVFDDLGTLLPLAGRLEIARYNEYERMMLGVLGQKAGVKLDA